MDKAHGFPDVHIIDGVSARDAAHLHAAMDLHFCHYNFVRFHRSIRCTPAMEAGIASTALSVKDLVEMAA